MKPIRLLFLLLLTLLLPIRASAALLRAGTLLRDAQTLLDSGHYEQAIQKADSVLTGSSNVWAQVNAASILAKANSAMSRYGEAEKAYLKGLELMRSTGLDIEEDKDYKAMLYNYAQFLQSGGRYDECLLTIEPVSWTPDSPEWLKAESLKASVYMRKGMYTTSLAILDAAIDIAEKTAGNETTLPVLLQNRGFLNLHTQKYVEAEADINRAITLLDGKKREIARANLALSLARQERYKEAEREIDAALNGLLRYTDRTDADYIIALRKKGEIAVIAGKEKEASANLRDFYNLEKRRLKTVLPTLTPHARLNYWTMEKPLLSKCFLAGEADAELAMDVALLRRETSLLGAYPEEETLRRLDYQTKNLKTALKPDEAAVAFITYPDADGKVMYAAVGVTSSGNVSFVTLFADSVIYTKNEAGISLYDALVSEDPADKNKLYADTVLAEMVWRPVIERLPKHVKTIHFAPEGVLHLWGIENMPFEGKENYRFVRRFSLADIRNDQAPSTPPNQSEILLSGGLDYDEKGESDYLTTQRRSANEAYVNLCEIMERKPGSTIFQYLPGTANEVRSIAEILPDATLSYTLTEESFKQGKCPYKVLHIATHGYALDCGLTDDVFATDSIGYDISMLRSGIALTGANVNGTIEGREDGIISAREICDLDLSDVEMVVLSACQTAKGLITDESASGLIRALKRAGVKTIVASLWEVDDRSAIYFMTSFYDALSNGHDKASALESAGKATATYAYEINRRKFDPGSLASRKTGEVREVHPYAAPWYWAPFIIVDP